jgi:hypothetical protein
MFFCVPWKKHMAKMFAVRVINCAWKNRLCHEKCCCAAFDVRTGEKTHDKRFVVHFSGLCRAFPAHNKAAISGSERRA